MTELTIDFQVLSPLYMGDAHQMAELRPPSIKGALRFWYRAIDPRFSQPVDGNARGGNDKTNTWEDHIFGGVRGEAQQSPFLLRVEKQPVQTFKWTTAWADGFNIYVEREQELTELWKSGKSLDGIGRDRGRTRDVKALNGMTYLGFPLHMKARDFEKKKGQRTQSSATASRNDQEEEPRSAILPTADKFTVRCFFPRHPDQRKRQAILASFWLLGHLGSLGTRSRRGFGSIALLDWREEKGERWHEKDELPLLWNREEVVQWQNGLKQALSVMAGWFGGYPRQQGSNRATFRHPHVGADFRCVLAPRGFVSISGKEAWESALQYAGSMMQDFRSRSSPDYEDVKAHILAALPGPGGRPLQHAPCRATFGLPLKFQYRSIKPRYFAPIFVPFDESRKTTFERHASLLHLRMVKIKDRIHPLFVRLDGAVPGIDPPVAVSKQSRHLRWPKENAMDAFLQSLSGS